MCEGEDVLFREEVRDAVILDRCGVEQRGRCKPKRVPMTVCEMTSNVRALLHFVRNAANACQNGTGDGMLVGNAGKNKKAGANPESNRGPLST